MGALLAADPVQLAEVAGSTLLRAIDPGTVAAVADPPSAGAVADASTVGLSLGWYRQTLFDSYHEVHAFQLGLYGGLLALALRARGYHHVPTALTLALLAFAFGFPDVYAVCHRSGEACGTLAVQTQPWYFLTGLVGASVVAPQVVRRSRRGLRRWRSGGPVPRAGEVDRGREVTSTDGGQPRSECDDVTEPEFPLN